MKPEDFYLAMQIIADNHTTELVINNVKENRQVEINHRIHIKHCCASVINKLIAHGFSLSMDHGLMSVNKY